MKLATLEVPLLNLRRTLESGQVFHWVPVGEGFEGVIGRRLIYLEQAGNCLRLTPGTEALVTRYLALDHPLEEVYATFPRDETLDAALAYCRGVRIIRQPLWECVATFITSAMKQVKHIAAISHTLRRRYGKPVARGYHAYPEPEALARLDEAALRDCALGFRAAKLLGAARAVAEGEVDLEAICNLPDAEAEAELCRLPGVGPKVAHCVLLFAYERVRAFPVDVWIARVLRERYLARRRKVTPAKMAEFAASYFGPYGGYAQQYLFPHARSTPTRRQSARRG